MKKSEIVQRLEAIEKHIGIAKNYDEVVSGYWYWFDKNSGGHILDALVFVNDVTLSNNGNYGFSHAGSWLDGKKVSYAVYNNLKIGRKATHKEVEEALVKHAELKYSGKKGKCLHSGYDLVFEDVIKWEWDNASLRYQLNNTYWGCVYCLGEWAEIIEQPVDKFAELKEAERNGYVIECRANKVGAQWVLKTHEIFADCFEYRIKPEEKPKVGDIVKVWDAKEGKFFIGTLYKKGIYNFPYPFKVKLYNSRDDYNFYGNAEKITKQEAIKLLFGDE